MIEQFVEDPGYAASFAEYDVGAIRASAGELDKKLDALFAALLDGDSGPLDGEGPTTNEAIQAAIAEVREKHGDKAGDFYDAAYGCAITNCMDGVMDFDPVFGRDAE